MKYPSYSAYKPSQMFWLDQMPQHWDAAALRWMSRRYAGGTPDKGNEAYWEDGDIPWLNSGAVNDGYITEPSALISREGFANSSAKWIPKDALVMALAGQGKTKGMVAQLGIETTCNQSMAAIIPDRRLAPRYLYWWLSANYQNIRNMAGGEARDGLNLDMLGSIQCPLPSPGEQQTIARFLDAKTAQIDTLVAKKRDLIDKLKEKRSGLISRTVTRGLPPEAAKANGLEPNPKMRDSGLQWIGSFPAHWQGPIKLSQLTAHHRHSFVNGPFGSDLLTSEITDEGVPIIYIRDIKLTGYVRVSESCVTEEKARQLNFCRVDAGDVVVAKVGDPPGTAAVYPDAENSGIVTQDVIRLKVDTRFVSPRFVCYFLNSAAGDGLVSNIAIESTRARVSLGDYKASLAILPPIYEQDAIVTFLDRETNNVDQLISRVETAISSLIEYRQALITSAVTGKIDVREAAA